MTHPRQLHAIPDDVAAWIRDVVLPAAYRANTGNIDRCPCQWSPSGHCQHGEHDKCQRTWGWARHGEPQPETYIASRRAWSALTPVWRAGRACRWLCPCLCHEQVQGLFPALPRTAGRSSGRGGNNRISSTARLRAFDDDPQLTLLELT